MNSPTSDFHDQPPVAVSSSPRTHRKAPRIPFLAGTLLGLVVLAGALYGGREFQVRRMADSVRERAESLAAEQRFGDAAGYFFRYLQLRPDDSAARARLAEVFDLSGGSPRRAVQLYQSALGAAEKEGTVEDKLSLRGRSVELLLDGGAFATAESEAEKLCQMEREPASGRSPAEWRGPGLKTLALFHQFNGKSAGVSRSALDKAFQQVLDPQAGEPQFYKDPRVYLARYQYRLQQQLPSAYEDLDAALRLAPRDIDVLLAAAVHWHQEALVAKRKHGLDSKAKTLFSDARRYYDRAIESSPSDPRSYLGLGQLFANEGDLSHAIETWQAGLKAAGERDVSIHLSLTDALLQNGRIEEAQNVLQSLDRSRGKLSPQGKLAVQPLIDFRCGQIALRQGAYQKAIALVQGLTSDTKNAAQSESGRQAIYQAWLVIGAANAGLKHWDRAIAAYDQASALKSRELNPLLGAASACAAAGRRSASIRYLQRALTNANAATPTPEPERQLIYARLIALLEQESRNDEAERYRALHAESVAQSTELTGRWAEEAVWNGRPEQALAIAQHAVKSRPNDPAAYLSLGSAWWAKGDTDEAKAAFQHAAKMAPEDIRVLVVLFHFCADAGDTDCARETLDKIAGHSTLTDVQRTVCLAEGYKKLGDVRLSRDAYRKAVAATESDPAAQMQLVEPLLRMDESDGMHEGEDVLRRLMTRHPSARRRLAELLLARGTCSAWEEGRQLLEDAPDRAASDEDRLLLAVALVRRGGKEDLAKADGICRQMLSDARKPGPGVELVLAQIEQSRGELEKTRHRYQSLANREPVSAAYVAIYVGFLMQHGAPEDVERGLEQLEQLAADDMAPVNLRANWLRLQGRSDEIEPLVEKWAERALLKADSRKRVQLAEAVGDLYRRTEQYACAERWYRRMMRIAPTRFESLAWAIAQQGRLPEALSLCEGAGAKDPSVHAALCMCGLLRSGRAAPDDFNRCEPTLEKALAAHGDNVDLLVQLAGVRVLQGETQEATQLFHRVLEQRPEHRIALNNLALLLSESSSPDERRQARDYIERAIEVFGPTSQLLDTKGTILLGEEDPERAIEFLKEAASVPLPDPRCCFHLAVAYCRFGQIDQARDALEQARKTNLDRQVLTALERSWLSELEKKLGS